MLYPRETSAHIPGAPGCATRVYHPLEDAHLPAEEHRVYFTSEEAAESLGYRPAGQTV